MGFYSYLSGFAVLGVLWVLYHWLGGTWNPCKLVEGADGRSSASKLQWFLWTVVVIFFYVAIYTARALKGYYEPITEIPVNLLTAMGFSVTTMAASKGITAAYVSSGRVIKTQVAPNSSGPGPIFQDDMGCPDLSKIQMLAWVLIAIGIYVLNAAHQIGTASPELPDIDPALMVLMGLGQGAYLGKKLTSSAVPRLTGLSQGSGKLGTVVTITGLQLGERQNGNLITIDGNPFSSASAPEWKETQIKFTIPAEQPDGRDWLAGQRICIGVIVGGQESTNTLPFTITT